MKRQLFLAAGLLLAGGLSAQAQRLVSRDFRQLDMDPTANIEKVIDHNGKPAALIKLFTPFRLSQLGFGGTLEGVTKTIQHGPGEIWVYVPENSMKITFVHPQYGELNVNYPAPLKRATTYALNLNAEGKMASLVASAQGATVELDGDSIGISPVNHYIPYGVHHVVARQGSLLFDDNIIVSPDGVALFPLEMVDENSKYGDVSIRVPEGVEIWFMGERAGVGEYHTRLREGQYSVETRKRDADPVLSAFTVTPGETSEVYPAPPVPHKGYLELNLMPETGVSVLSGDTIFTTQRNLQLPVGPYELTFEKRGYYPQTRLVRVAHNQTTVEDVSLVRRQYVKKSSVWASVGFEAAIRQGIAFNIGGAYENIELEAGFTLGLGKSKEVKWYTIDNSLLNNVEQYRVNEVNIAAGYRFRFAERFGLTPRLGYQLQYLHAGSGHPGNGFTQGSLTVGVKGLYIPVPHFGIYLTPQYGIPMGAKGQIKEVCSLGDITRGGFRLEVGVELSL